MGPDEGAGKYLREGLTEDVTLSVIIMTVQAERTPVHFISHDLHQAEHFVIPFPRSAVEVTGAARYAIVLEGKGIWIMRRIDIPNVHVAGMAHLTEEELGLVVLTQTAAFFPHMADEAEVIHRSGDQAETVPLVTILRVNVICMTTGAIRNVSFMRVDSVL